MNQRGEFPKQRKQLLKRILLLIPVGKYNQIVLFIKELMIISTRLYYSNKIRHIYDYLTDCLLLSKFYAIADKIQLSLSTIQSAWKLASEFFSQDRYLIKSSYYFPLEEVKLSKFNFEVPFNDELEERSPKEVKFVKPNILKEVKRRGKILSVFGSLFFNLDDEIGAEQAYTCYVQMIIANFGARELEASNAYFMLGVFYMDIKKYQKAIACFSISLQIRAQIYGLEHGSIADCLANMGVCYCLSNYNYKKGGNHLNTALVLRNNLNGHRSLQVAKILEIQGCISQLKQDYKNALRLFEEALDIKVTYYSDQGHREIQKSMKCLQTLRHLIKDEMDKQEMENDSKSKDIMSIIKINNMDASKFDSRSKINEIENQDKSVVNLTEQQSNQHKKLTNALFGNKNLTNLNSIKRGEFDNLSSERIRNKMRGIDIQSSLSSQRRNRDRRKPKAAFNIFDDNQMDLNSESGEIGSDSFYEKYRSEESDLSVGGEGEILSSRLGANHVQWLSTDEDERNRLSAAQKNKLEKLVDTVFRNNLLKIGYQPINDILMSGFYKSLSSQQKEKFQKDNFKIFGFGF